MTRLLLSLVGFFVVFGAGILVMIFGWGLQPQSWGWILGGGLISCVIGAIFQMDLD